ncbi:hypothetical protein NPIL_396281 [Nephila pilipes]|uniref:Uncharacterized protein n=1 Tax=Nephila pilipes TaxID=299642 RepID=A0A8X6I6F7_NEPPI|nr:hypothetical protein NPIL_396281 [Nephila pilipes]
MNSNERVQWKWLVQLKRPHGLNQPSVFKQPNNDKKKKYPTKIREKSARTRSTRGMLFSLSFSPALSELSPHPFPYCYLVSVRDVEERTSLSLTVRVSE